MATRAEIEQQLTRERSFRRRLGLPAVLGGVLYLVSAVVVGATLGKTPAVGLLQGLAPALRGEAEPRVSPRAEEVRFVSHHAAPLILSSVLAAAAVLALTVAVLALWRATRFRRPESWPPTAAFLLSGGVAFAAIGVAHQVALAITTHQFATGHDFSNHAVDRALTKGTANVTLGYLGFIAGVALAVGMIAT
ncbi:MAG: hypothetical protein FWD42_06340, partial [Solirubrobacterales bacterium]|nr:hypothetical protein [Solirubrobacterales bacterium]